MDHGQLWVFHERHRRKVEGTIHGGSRSEGHPKGRCRNRRTEKPSAHLQEGVRNVHAKRLVGGIADPKVSHCSRGESIQADNVDLDAGLVDSGRNLIEESDRVLHRAAIASRIHDLPRGELLGRTGEEDGAPEVPSERIDATFYRDGERHGSIHRRCGYLFPDLKDSESTQVELAAQSALQPQVLHAEPVDPILEMGACNQPRQGPRVRAAVRVRVEEIHDDLPDGGILDSDGGHSGRVDRCRGLGGFRRRAAAGERERDEEEEGGSSSH